jgi:hypothetical protein
MSLFTTGIIEEFLTTHQNGRYVFQFVLSATGAGTFTVPAGVTQIDVGCWGGGSAGLGIETPSGVGASILPGGGGGGFAWSSLSVSGGQVFSYYVGEGGNARVPSPVQIFDPSIATYMGLSGGTTFIGPSGCNAFTSTIRAMGGGGGLSSFGNPSNNGGGSMLYFNNLGQITYNGGNGALGSQVVPYKTGGGGGGAGSTAVGDYGKNSTGFGDWASGGTATATLGGAGGLGFYIEQIIINSKSWGDGTDAYRYGGGGGGCGRYGTAGANNIYGGSGAQGLIIINCIIP